MFRFLFYTCLFFLTLFSVSQERYQLPKGITRDQIDEQWIVIKVKDPSIPISLFNSENEVVIFHEVDPTKPSVMDGLCKVKLRGDQDIVEILGKLNKDPNVVYAEPLLNYQPLYAPVDPSNSTNQFYLDQIKAYDAWSITRGDDDITIGIVDTGLDLDHQDLVTNLWVNENDPIDGLDNDNNGYVDDRHGYDFADRDSEPNADGSTHGSQVGGIAGAATDNNIGMSGVGFNTKIAALKGFRTVGTLSNNLFEAITYAADNGIGVLNLSWGALRDGLQSEQDVINYAVLERDVVVVAAGGNTNVDGKFHPASYDNVLSVGGVDSNDNRWSISTYNYSIDLMAPSVGIYSTSTNDGYVIDQGTSFAAPMVAGAAALVKSRYPDLNALQIMERVRVTADDIYDVGSNSTYDGKLGYGRLNVLNAVEQNNVKALRATTFAAETSQSDALFFGDTVQVDTKITNYLARLTNPQISISSPDNAFTVLDSDFFPGSMNTLAEDSISFQIVLNDNLSPESPVDIRLDIQDGLYTDFQYLETETSPDYFDFGANLVSTVSGNGNLAYADASFTEGIGIEFEGINVLTHSGLVIAASSATTSDNFVSNYASLGREQDFNPSKNFKLFYHPGADLYGYSEFTDPVNELVIEQSSYAWTGEDAIVIRYRIVNNSAIAINDLSAGFYTDFDLVDGTSNKASFEASNNYVMTRDNGGTLFTGTKIISNGTLRYSAIDLESQNGNTADIGVEFTDTDKYDFLRNLQIGSAGDVGVGNNVATMNGITISQINAYESEYVSVIIAAGHSQAELEATIVQAENNLNNAIANPWILEETFSCGGSQVTVDPTSGTTFRFYEDANGTTLIQEGTSFLTGAINQDTSFYVRNVDGAYASDLFQYRIKLIEEVADFKMSTDTLYLDHATNVVSFTDQSFQANLWNWDFGEGTSSTLQNPSLSFNLPGVYPISLYIENSLGCSDTQVKNLVVANRPAAPVFSTFSICPGESITLTDATADYLSVFENETEDYIAKGNDLTIGPFDRDSTLYVSGTYSQFESLRIPITIDVDEVDTQFQINIDTTSIANQLIASTEIINPFEWFVDGISQGSANVLTIAESQTLVTVRLQAQNQNGCSYFSEQSFAFSSSPIPSQSDVAFCVNEPATLRPQNGTYFGFYDDEAMTRLIKKGKELSLNEQTKVFIVGLDDGLPSIPREVNISWVESSVEIQSSVEVIDGKNRVSLSINETGFDDFTWYVDRQLTETTNNPILFFDNTLYEIIVEASSTSGCTASDTLVLDLTPPLGLADESEVLFYPNPSSGTITIQKEFIGSTGELWDLSGKRFIHSFTIETQDVSLTSIPKGIYLLRLNYRSLSLDHKLILR